MVVLRSSVVRVAAVAALGLVGGCAADGSGRERCEPEVCDPRDMACVEQAAEIVACERGTEIFVPTVRFATAAEWLAEREPQTPEELEAMRNYYAGEALVGLMPPGYNPEEATADDFRSVVALYDPRPEEIVILTDRTSDDAISNYAVLVHEVVHANQDREHDLISLFDEHASSFDRSLAMRAAIEGEATLHQMFVYADVDGIPRDEVNWRNFYDGWQEDSLVAARNTETPSLDASGLFPYSFGGGMTFEGFEIGGQPIVSDFVAHPPDSTRQVMLGYGDAHGSGANHDATLAPSALPILPGHIYLGGSQQGAWLINTMLQRTARSLRTWERSVDNVSADELGIFMNEETGERVAVWRLLGWSSAPTAFNNPGSRWQIGSDGDGTHAAFVVDDSLVLVAAEHTPASELFASILGWRSVEETIEEGGAPRGPPRRGPMMP